MSQELETVMVNLEKEVPRFINDNLKSWINETVLKTVIRRARAANMPKTFIENIAIEPYNGGYALVNNWVEDKKPLGIFFEYGTEDHWVEPIDPKGVLAFPSDGGGSHGKAINFQSGDAGVKFSKGHYVSGIFGYQPMTLGMVEGKKRLIRKIKREVKMKFATETENFRVRVKI